MNKYCIVFFFFYSSLVFSQEKRIEDIYQKCAYNTLSDKGKALKHYSKGFEEYLIEKQILKDSTPLSYYNLFKSFSDGKIYNTDNFKYSYSDSINKNKEDRLKIFPNSKKCIREVSKLRSFKKYMLENPHLTNNNDLSINDLLKRSMNVLKVEDFKLDYYKQRTFILLYLLSDFR